MKTSMFYMYLTESDTGWGDEAFQKMNLVFRLPGIGDKWYLDAISVWEYSGDPAEFVCMKTEHGQFFIPAGPFPVEDLYNQSVSLDDARMRVAKILCIWLIHANSGLITDKTCAYLEELIQRFGESIREFCGKWYGCIKRELDIFDIRQSVRGRHYIALAANP